MNNLPDPQSILDRGEAAKATLNDAMFLTALNDVSDFHLAAMVSSPEGPQGATAREHHHRMLLAHREVVEQLQLYVAASAEVLERQRIARVTAGEDINDQETEA